MTEDERLLILLQHGDSFFPSGAISFSWGLEMLKNDNMITSIGEVESFLESQLVNRWGTFERVVLAHCYDRANDPETVIPIDTLVECMTLASELREGSKKLGLALLATYSKLNNPVAQQYYKFVHENHAYGHLPVTQGLVWHSMGLSKTQILMLSAHSFCVSVLSAALRLSLASHIDCQKSLSKLRGQISKILSWPITDVEEIHGFTPFSDIASMRHESSDTRLFAN